jgi:DNA repair exonuclease SbcCD ATPase subunit
MIFRKLRFKGIFAVGQEWIEVRLDRHSSSLFMGPNGSGKSTFIDALCFVLYKKPFKKITLPEMVNAQDNKNLLVEIEFEVGDIEYKVRRGIKPNLFEIYKNGNLIEQDAKTGDYQDFLENTILKMNYKSFTQIVVLGIANYVPFMRLKVPERRIVVEDLLNYQVFSVMNSLLKEKVSAMKPALQEIEVKLRIVDEKIAANDRYLEERKKNNDGIIEKKKAKLKEIKSYYETNKKTLTDDKSEFESLNSVMTEEEDIRDMIQEIEAEIKQHLNDTRIADEESDFYTHNESCPTCQQGIDQQFVQERLKSLATRKSNNETKIKLLDSKKEPLLNRQVKINAMLFQATELSKKISGTESLVSAYLNQAKSINAEIKALKEAAEQDEYQDLSKELTIEKNNLLAEKQELGRQAAIQSNAAMLLKDTGIKARLIRSYVPKMNELINKFLVELDFFGHFEIDENFDAVIRARHRDELSYDGLSQGQKLRIDLALLFTWRELAKIRSNAKTNLLIFDEVCDSSLDDAGVEDLMKVLNGMMDGHNIFIISHKGDAIIDKFEQVYRFDLVQGYTQMKEIA